MQFFDLARMTVASTGSSDIQLSAAVQGFLTFDLAGMSTAPAGQSVRYAINDNTVSEIGLGTYYSSGPHLRNRTPEASTTGGSSAPTTVQVSNSAQVFCTPSALDWQTYTEIAPQCGRLAVVSALSIKFSPFNGDLIKVDGVVYRIPAAGITSANTATFVNGVGGSNLAVSTAYRVYVFNNGGTLTLDFCTTSHATSTTAGNVGTEIKAADDSRTLVGMTLTSGAGQFQSNITGTNVTAGQIYTINWFNRRYLTIGNGNNNHQTTGSGTLVNISNTFSYVGSWGDSGTSAAWSGIVTNDTTGSSVLTSFSVDGVSAPNSGNISVTQVASASYAYTAGMTYGAVLSEGFHYFGISASVSPNGIASILGIGDSLLTITIFG